jgi:hypothetical protein
MLLTQHTRRSIPFAGWSNEAPLVTWFEIYFGYVYDLSWFLAKDIRLVFCVVLDDEDMPGTSKCRSCVTVCCQGVLPKNVK